MTERQRLLRFIAVPWRKLYRRSMLAENEIRFPVSNAFYEDNPVHWFSIISARSLAVVPEVLCYHRVNRAGQTMATADERLFQIFSHHDTIHAWLQGRRLLDVYETSLIGWVISQLEWISARTPAGLRRTLFDLLVPIFAGYSPATITAALREGNKGVTAQRLSSAIAKQEYGSFVRTLSSRPGSKANPVVSAAFHLRHSGIRHTALLAGRYTKNTIRSSRAQRVVNRLLAPRREPRGQDLMFALLVLQQRIATLQERLEVIDAKLGDRDRNDHDRVDHDGGRVR